jgi:PAT family beta-lactamase induction signal transducer AmpG
LFWVGLLYFAEGFPLGVFYDVFPVQFRQSGVDLRDIGLIGLIGLAWTLKFLWAPAIDHYRHHRRWMAGADLAMGAVLVALAVQGDFGPSVWFAIGVFALLSATNDIAIDGYTIELLDKRELGLANGLRIGLYRVGMLTSGVMLMLSDYLGWMATYMAGALLLGLLALACLQAPRERAMTATVRISLARELRTLLTHPTALAAVVAFLLGSLWLVDRTTQWSQQWPALWTWAFVVGATVVGGGVLFRTPGNNAWETLSHGPMFGALMALLRRRYMLPVIAFILLFKLGDAAMGLMVKPFWVDAGFSASAIGLVSVNLGLVLSIAGGVVGGAITDRIGIFHALWILGLFQALSNLAYAFAAHVIPVAGDLPSAHVALMYGASGLESFTGGLGTAAFLAFLMAIVQKEHSATEYALLSSVFALSRSLAGWASGYGAESLGYSVYFFVTFLLAFPAYVLLPWVRKSLDLNRAG